MKNERYLMSFATGGLYHRESLKLALLFLECKDWNLVRERVLIENLLQSRTLSTSKRVSREVISRLKTLDLDEIDLLVQSSAHEQGYLLWMAVCRRYQFIADFAIEVLRERFLSMKYDLQYEDFDSFFNRKSDWHSELDEIRPLTRMKLRQVLFKMLREAELLTVDHTIHAVILSSRLQAALSRGDRKDLLVFPILDSELGGLTP